ncbi:MAG TPA: hypothetical protein VLG08_11995 [Casimicrobiaceae bacterium]|nr:hypothetical protein [Casimicrobiaceae bacterium]
METRDPPSSQTRGLRATRAAWHVVALLLALAIAWLVFAAYRQPDFILDFAGVRLC